MTLGGKLGIYIDYLLGGQIWKTIHEKSQRTLDSVVQLNALGFANAPPTSGHGDTYIVGAAPTGAFAGQAPGAVATYHSTLGGWEFYTPLKGWRGYIGSDMYYYNGSAWGLEANLPGASAVAAITAQNVAASVAGAEVANHAASGDHDARYVNVGGDTSTGTQQAPYFVTKNATGVQSARPAFTVYGAGTTGALVIQTCFDSEPSVFAATNLRITGYAYESQQNFDILLSFYASQAIVKFGKRNGKIAIILGGVTDAHYYETFAVDVISTKNSVDVLSGWAVDYNTTPWSGVDGASGFGCTQVQAGG
jgi:Protein of unknown function (DUF2793)